MIPVSNVKVYFVTYTGSMYLYYMNLGVYLACLLNLAVNLRIYSK